MITLSMLDEGTVRFRPCWGGSRRTVVGKIDRDGTVYLSGELPQRKGFAGFALSLRPGFDDVECARLLLEPWSFAVDGKRPEVTQQNLRQKLAVCGLEIGLDCIRLNEEAAGSN